MNGQYRPGNVVLGKWTLTRLIGEGSFGRVFEAEREDFGRTYKAAIKIITIPRSPAEVQSVRGDGLDEESVTAYFRGFVEEMVEEFALMEQLKGNTNVVSYEDHEVLRHESGIGWDIFIRMELLTPLLTHVGSRAMTEREVIRLGLDLCKALELCQKHRIIHRDIKPENIFVSDNGDFKLGDFGIARTAEKTTGGLSKKGTYSYMAPEVYREQPYGASADLYSLGLVLYWLLNERRTPFLPLPPENPSYGDREQALKRRMSGEPIPDPLHGSEALRQVVRMACAYDPKDRFASPAAMARALGSLSGVPVPEAVPAGATLEPPESAFSGTDPEPTESVFSGEAAMETTESIFPGTVPVPEPMPQPETPRKRGKRFLWLAVAAAAVAVAAGLWFLRTPGDPGAATEEPASEESATVESQQPAVSQETADEESADDGFRRDSTGGSVTCTKDAQGYPAEAVYRSLYGGVYQSSRFTCDEDGRVLTAENTYFPEGLLRGTTVYTYDEAGRCVEERTDFTGEPAILTYDSAHFYAYDSVTGGSAAFELEVGSSSRRVTWEYDDSDRPIRGTEVWETADGETVFTWQWEYDEIESAVFLEKFDAGGEQIGGWVYDETGACIHVERGDTQANHRYDDTGTLLESSEIYPARSCHTVYTYNADGDCVRTEVTNVGGGEITCWYEAGRCTRSETVNDAGTEVVEYSYTDGYITRLRTAFPDGTAQLQENTYEDGRCIRRQTTYADGSVLTLDYQYTDGWPTLQIQTNPGGDTVVRQYRYDAQGRFLEPELVEPETAPEPETPSVEQTVEERVADIRQWYSEIESTGGYTTEEFDGGEIRRMDGVVSRITWLSTEERPYTCYTYFREGRLFFAHAVWDGDGSAYRLYYGTDGNLIRWIDRTDTVQSSAAADDICREIDGLARDGVALATPSE